MIMTGIFLATFLLPVAAMTDSNKSTYSSVHPATDMVHPDAASALGYGKNLTIHRMIHPELQQTGIGTQKISLIRTF